MWSEVSAMPHMFSFILLTERDAAALRMNLQNVFLGGAQRKEKDS